MERMQYGEGRFIPLGDQQEVTPPRQLHAEGIFEQRESYARKSRTHMWVVIVTHFATDQMLDAFAGKTGELPILDADTLAMRPGVMCYICAEPYTDRLKMRRCKGDGRHV